ncbi:MAG: hypothetical protein INR68_02810 [Methylobacterium mesophilicum]|nr:hypothetical protein [Methylobacterium mesophilicum]
MSKRPGSLPLPGRFHIRDPSLKALVEGAVIDSAAPEAFIVKTRAAFGAAVEIDPLKAFREGRRSLAGSPNRGTAFRR